MVKQIEAQQSTDFAARISGKLFKLVFVLYNLRKGVDPIEIAKLIL